MAGGQERTAYERGSEHATVVGAMVTDDAHAGDESGSDAAGGAEGG
jgi:hypothetical protein